MKTDTFAQIYSNLKTTEAALKEIKKTYRDPEQQPPKLSIYRNLWKNKRNATLFYMAIAMGRGRVHRHDGDLETQREYVEKHIGELLEGAAAA